MNKEPGETEKSTAEIFPKYVFLTTKRVLVQRKTEVSCVVWYLKERTIAALLPKITDKPQAMSDFNVATTHPETYKLLTT